MGNKIISTVDTPLFLEGADVFFERERADILRTFQDALPKDFLARHGDLPRWLTLLSRLPPPVSLPLSVQQGAVCLGDKSHLPKDFSSEQLKATLLRFHPFRKGPFNLMGLFLDTEWRSDRKWARLSAFLPDLVRDKQVLDVGSSNGYYLFRALFEGARLCVGVERSLLYSLQFELFARYSRERPIRVYPLPIELVPPFSAFDTLFSMGVIYHVKEPLSHLKTLRGFVRLGGRLVLETLIHEGESLFPKRDGRRYAKMNNVHTIPSIKTVEAWFLEAGFRAESPVDITPTTEAEQRATDWMHFESLKDFLNPKDPRFTLEGYPAPVRALWVVEAV